MQLAPLHLFPLTVVLTMRTSWSRYTNATRYVVATRLYRDSTITIEGRPATIKLNEINRRPQTVAA